MSVLKSYFWPEVSASGDVLTAARQRLVHIMCLMSAIITVFYAWGEIALVLRTGYNYSSALLPYVVIPVTFFVMAGLVAKGRFVKTCSVLLLIFTYLFTMSMRVDTGAFTPGSVFFMALPMLAGMLLGVRAGLISVAVVVVTYGGLLLFRHDMPPPARVPDADEIAWQSAVTFSVLSAACTGSALLFMHAMNNVIAKLRSTNAELNVYKQNLEQLVEARTQTVTAQAEELHYALAAQKEANALQNTLVSVVSHEIRTPLAIIDGTARRMTKNPEKLTPEDIHTRSETIRQSVKCLTQLVERTLESARYAEGAMALQPVDFNFRAFVQGVIVREQEQFASHRISADLSGLPDNYRGDPNLLDHVISNILCNAVKYSPENEAIELTTEQTDCDYIIRIKDFGVGIPADELPRISNRFFRASTAQSITGTGVGLFLAKRITEDHHGHLEINSEAGEWTEVSVHLPVTPTVALVPLLKAANAA